MGLPAIIFSSRKSISDRIRVSRRRFAKQVACAWHVFSPLSFHSHNLTYIGWHRGRCKFIGRYIGIWVLPGRA